MIRDAIRRAAVPLALLCLLPARADDDAARRALDAGRPAEAPVEWRAAVPKQRAAPAADMTPVQLAEAPAAAMTLAQSTEAPAAELTLAQSTEAPTASPAPAPAVVPAPAPTVVPPPQTTLEVQALLAALGYAPGPLDGIWGPRTELAYQAFLGDSELPAAETPVPRALQEMRTLAARRGVEPESVDAAVLRARGLAFRDCPECPEVVVVPSGSYEMGSPASEDGRSGAEGPVHRVTIPEPFAVGMYEVTFSQWDACVADGGCGGYRPDDEGWGRGDRPVVNVSWRDAQAYVDWLTGRTGKRYRLPSESEWEYAARAGTTTPFHTGSTISTEQANYDGSHVYGAGRTGDYRKRTVPVGSFAPNRFGLHDVHGNVWEWVEDCWNDSYRGAPSDGSAWVSGSCKSRVLRGGSWDLEPSDLRSAFRVRNTTGARFAGSGIRVVRTLAP